MFKLTLKELFGKKLRLITTALAVMLGVAFMAGTLVLTDTIGRTFDGLFTEAYSGTDAYVRGEKVLESSTDTPPVAASMVDAVAAVDGVKHAVGTVSGYAQLVDHKGKALGNAGAGAPTLGDAWIDDADLNYYDLVEGHAPTAANEIVIDKHSAKTAHFVLGETVTVLTKGGSDQFTIVGVVKFGDADSIGGASQVLFTSAQAQQLVGTPGQFDAIAVVAADGVTPEQVTANIARILPAHAEVITGAELTKQAQKNTQDGMSFFNTFLLIFAGIALFVGAFIIFNTFSIIITQRQKEMALLRAIGASSKQVVRSVMLEATVVGGIASLAGLGTGIGVAAGLKKLLSSMGIDLPAGNLVINTSTIVVSIVVGTGVTLASAFFPARKAGKVPPIAAMRDVAVDKAGASRKRMVAGTAITATGVASLLGGLSAGDIKLVGVGALATFVGVTVLAPVFALPAARLLGWPAARLTRMTGSLARRNAMRSPKRTAATAAALMIGVALVGFISTFAASTKASLNDSVDKDFHGSFVLDSGTFGGGGISHSLTTDIASRPEFDTVTSSRFFVAEVDGEESDMQSWDASTLPTLFDLDPQQGDIASLGATDVALEEAYAKEINKAIGDTVEVRFDRGTVNLTVAAIFGDPTFTGSAFVDHSVPDSLGIDPLDATIYIHSASTTDLASAKALLEDLTKDFPTADVLDRAEFKESKASNIDLILNLIYALLALAIIIALMGITNTLALSIFERTRELGVLRALGMTRGQLKSSVRFEAIIISLFGTLLGLSVGVFFGWAVVKALAEEGIDTLAIPVPTLAIVTTIAALAGVAASVLPGRRASRLDVLEAIAS